MNIASPVFLFLFFPITVAGYYVIRGKLRNLLLLAASLFFYAWGEPKLIILLITSIAVNYIIALGIEHFRKNGGSRVLVILMLIWNFGILYYYKYHVFVLNNLNGYLGSAIPVPEITLPLGISFFTFRAVSYGLDIYWEVSPVQRDPVSAALYISFFPQLLMGPITRYSEFEKQLAGRRVSVSSLSDGVRRIIIGLAKKVILANQLGIMVDSVFSMAHGERSVLAAWLGVVGYMLQLYFDFSGYSDMAAGMGKIFGFETPENFRYPYLSKSVAEYWTRWHITLGTWLKIYLYTPVFRAVNGKTLLGKRISLQYTDYIALVAVWLFAGIWHGAAWHYVLFGMYNCFFILLERIRSDYQKAKRKKLKLKKQPETRLQAAAAHIYLLIVVLFGSLMFRIPGADAFLPYVKGMFGLAGNAGTDPLSVFLLKEYSVMLAISVVGVTPLLHNVAEKAKEKNETLAVCVGNVCLVALMILCAGYTVTAFYNPFLYQNF